MENQTLEATLSTRTCPFCGEQISETAQKCKHCGEWLVTENHGAKHYYFAFF